MIDLKKYAQYPISEIIPEALELLQNENRLVIEATTGAGKSTVFPLSLLNEPWLDQQKIIVLEPRRLAAKSVASRMAEMLGEVPGETIGYRVRQETKTSAKTKLEVVTEGILTNILSNDNLLEGYGCVVFDEFHERNIHSDLGIALVQELQNELRPELRIVVMSATIDTEHIAKSIKAAALKSEGRIYPVEVKYQGDIDLKELNRAVVQNVFRALKEHEGNILVFLPGKAWIDSVQGGLKEKAVSAQVHPLCGSLNFKDQQKAIQYYKGIRKVILATNVAETSLTIEGIGVVIDAGLEFRAKYNPNSGLQNMNLVRISKQSADQRKGRAGRRGPGACYRLWSKATQLQMKDYVAPEIETSDLTPLALTLARWGNPDGQNLNWITPPAQFDLQRAKDFLIQINAIDKNQITDLGRELLKIPTHPRLANILIYARTIDSVALAMDSIPFIEEKDPLMSHPELSLGYRIQMLRRNRKSGQLGYFKAIQKSVEHIGARINAKIDNGKFDEYLVGALLAKGFPERIAKLTDEKKSIYLMANGRSVHVPQPNSLRPEPWVVVVHVNMNKNLGKALLIANIKEQDLLKAAATSQKVLWTKANGLVAERQRKVGSIVLHSEKLKDVTDAEVIAAIHEAMPKDGAQLLNWSERVEQLLLRLSLLNDWLSELDCPVWTKEELLNTTIDWLDPYLSGKRKNEELQKIDLYEVLYYRMTPEVQEKLNQYTPENIDLENGKSVKVKYQTGEYPALVEIKLQHCFGVLSTPKVNNGKTSVLMHLLSPGYKLVQITSDLESFWQNAYFEIRKEMRIKYKKHPWPENPLNQQID